jgi:hypothetical protein
MREQLSGVVRWMGFSSPTFFISSNQIDNGIHGFTVSL